MDLLLSSHIKSDCWWFRNPANHLLSMKLYEKKDMYSAYQLVQDFFYQQYFTNLDIPEISGFTFQNATRSCEVAIIWPNDLEGKNWEM